MIIILSIISPFCLFSDSFTFSTEINSVSNYSGFGMGLFPVGTTFAYYNYFPFLNKREQAKAYLEANMNFSTPWLDSNYDYQTGEPVWVNTVEEAKSLNRLGGQYFNPNAYINLWIQQGFGTNPVSGNSPLFIVRVGVNSRYSMALEKINNTNYIFVDSSGESKKPFGTGSSIPAFPWLEGNRKTLNNYLFLHTYWYLRRWMAYDYYEGIYGELNFEYGPSWFANTLYPGGVQSNFYRFYGYLEEKLTLLNNKQDNGRDWTVLYVGHSNSLSYIGGDVVPINKIPSDRLRWTATDRIWLRFTGPQFISSDCYSYIQFNLGNDLYFGHVVNETSQETTAIELQSYLSGTFHLRLFGFIRFEYNIGYNLFRGIWSSSPGWWQNAKLNFYVSV